MRDHAPPTHSSSLLSLSSCEVSIGVQRPWAACRGDLGARRSTAGLCFAIGVSRISVAVTSCARRWKRCKTAAPPKSGLMCVGQRTAAIVLVSQILPTGQGATDQESSPKTFRSCPVGFQAGAGDSCALICADADRRRSVSPAVSGRCHLSCGLRLPGALTQQHTR